MRVSLIQIILGIVVVRGRRSLPVDFDHCFSLADVIFSGQMEISEVRVIERVYAKRNLSVIGFENLRKIIPEYKLEYELHRIGWKLLLVQSIRQGHHFRFFQGDKLNKIMHQQFLIFSFFCYP